MEFLKSKIVYESKRFNVEEATYKNKDGDIIEHYHVKSPEAVVILPITKEGKIVLVKQQRTAIGNQMVIELPAGKVDPGETPEKTAIRELHEETGYIAKDVKYIFSYYPSNGLSDEKLHFFITKDLEVKTLQNLTEDEEIEVVEMLPDEALQMIFEHKQENGHSIIALLYYKAYMGTK
ncbi:MAG: NUDIX hydrolase [Clostridia bacterium]|nr:NUDIX hydrolase [Clostridia bacterium]